MCVCIPTFTCTYIQCIKQMLLSKGLALHTSYMFMDFLKNKPMTLTLLVACLHIYIMIFLIKVTKVFCVYSSGARTELNCLLHIIALERGLKTHKKDPFLLWWNTTMSRELICNRNDNPKCIQVVKSIPVHRVCFYWACHTVLCDWILSEVQMRSCLRICQNEVF